MPAPYLPDPIPGVYGVICRPTRRRYIGQSKDCPDRWRTELNQLHARCHHNAELQADYDQHGPTAFLFTILDRDLPDESDRLDREHLRITRELRRGTILYNRNLDRDDGRDWR